MSYSIVGKSLSRIDSRDKVTGGQKFCSDFRVDGMLYGKVLRSPHAYARILSIDTSKAEALPGVRGVITGKDVPDKRSGASRYAFDQYVLARGEALFAGEAVAAVAADSLEIAEQAIELIKVDYEPLQGLFDVEKAWDNHPPAVLHPDLPKYEQASPLHYIDPEHPNVCNHYKVRHGDVEIGFKDADFIFEDRFSTAKIQHSPLEPHSCIVSAGQDGSITLWAARQQLYGARQYLCRTFDLPPSKVRVIASFYIGGAFGSKFFFGIEPIAVLLSKKTGRPVKITLTREEIFISGGSRIPCIIDIKDGVKKDGTVVARELKILVDVGAYASYGGAVLTRNSSFGAIGLYRLPNFKLDAYGVYTNKPPVCALRGFASEQATWAVESHLDMIAEKLGMDPQELRRKNILNEGDINANGQTAHSIGAKECLGAVEKFIEWGKKPEKSEGPWRRGKGIAVGTKFSFAGGAAITLVKILEDGVVEVRFAADDFGQGSNMVMAQIAAEEFGVTVDRVRIVWDDTLTVPYSNQTVSQGTTFNTGNSVKLACLDARRQLFEIAAVKLKALPDELSTRGGKVFVKADPSRSIGINELYRKGYIDKVGEIMGKGVWQPVTVVEDENGQTPPELAKKGLGPSAFYGYTGQAVQVAVNVETGEIKVEKFGSAADMGFPINPKMCEQQIEGGVGMGIGTTLMEEMKLDNGIVLNANFRDYKLPEATSIPELENIKSFITPAPHRDGPYGAKGFTESSLVPTAPAIANAVYNAIGVRIKDLPLSPERVLKAIKDKEK